MKYLKHTASVCTFQVIIFVLLGLRDIEVKKKKQTKKSSDYFGTMDELKTL